MASQSPSQSPQGTPKSTSSPSLTKTQSPTQSPTESPTVSYSLSQSPSQSPEESPSAFPSQSPQGTPSQSQTQSSSPSNSYAEISIFPIFTNISIQINIDTTINELISLTQNITPGKIIKTSKASISTLEPSNTTQKIEFKPSQGQTIEVSAKVPPLPIPKDAKLLFFAWDDNVKPDTNFTTTSILSFQVRSKLNKELAVSNLSEPVVLNWKTPTPTNFSADCVFWNYTSQSWSSDGCKLIEINSTISCSCTHLTDFAVRFKSILDTNSRIFANAASVYSMESLRRAAAYYIFLGTLVGIVIISAIYLHKLDIAASFKYSDYLSQLQIFNHLKEIHGQDFFIDRLIPIKSSSAPTALAASPQTTAPPPNTIIRRLCLTCLVRLPIYHPQLSLIFRFDPLLPRVTRFLFLITTLCNTLFFIAFLYGYSNLTTSSDAKAKEPLSPVESIVLSLLTLLLNTPIIQGFLFMLRAVGRSEFAWRYPYLFQELQIRKIFEQTWNAAKDEDTLADIKDNIIKNLGKISPFTEYYPKSETSAQRWLRLPIKSFMGFVFLTIQIICIAWTFNYLLLFAVTQYASDSTGSSEKNIFTSFGFNQIISIFISGPLNILINLIVNWLLIRYGHLIRIKRPEVPEGSDPLDFLSDPFTTKNSIGLTSELSHYLFIQGPMLVSKKIINNANYDDIIIATDKAIAMNWYMNLAGKKETVKKMDKNLTIIRHIYQLLYRKF